MDSNPNRIQLDIYLRECRALFLCFAKYTVNIAATSAAGSRERRVHVVSGVVKPFQCATCYEHGHALVWGRDLSVHGSADPCMKIQQVSALDSV